jgi:biotin carboxyl carrier protein
MGGVGQMKVVARVGDHEFRIRLDEAGMVCVDDEVLAVELESLDGGFHYSLLVGASSHEVFIERCGDLCTVILEGHRYQVRVEDEWSRPASRALRPSPADQGQGQVKSPMPGVVVAVLAREGQIVRTGESLAILEAMKMENEIRAPLNGTVGRVLVSGGQRVAQGDLLFSIDFLTDMSQDTVQDPQVRQR